MKIGDRSDDGGAVHQAALRQCVIADSEMRRGGVVPPHFDPHGDIRFRRHARSLVEAGRRIGDHLIAALEEARLCSASSSSVGRAGDSVRRSADTGPNGDNEAEGGMLSTSRWGFSADVADTVLAARTSTGRKGLGYRVIGSFSVARDRRRRVCN